VRAPDCFPRPPVRPPVPRTCLTVGLVCAACPAALAAVVPPDGLDEPLTDLPAEVIEHGLLSTVQLVRFHRALPLSERAAVRACLLAHTAARRSVCPPPQEMIEYANMRHEKLLKSGERAGFLLGDGAGMGKGRQIAGIMFHNLRKGNMKYARPCCCHCSSPLASASSVLAD
jgi:hypothetical protein